MKDFSRETWEAGRPAIEPLDGVNFCLDEIFKDKKHEATDIVAGGYSYGELIGVLLLVRDVLLANAESEREALERELDEFEDDRERAKLLGAGLGQQVSLYLERRGIKVHHHSWKEDLYYFSYVRLSEIPRGIRKDFEAWADGMTRPVIDGLDPQDAFYVLDFAAFLSAINPDYD